MHIKKFLLITLFCFINYNYTNSNIKIDFKKAQEDFISYYSKCRTSDSDCNESFIRLSKLQELNKKGKFCLVNEITFGKNKFSIAELLQKNSAIEHDKKEFLMKLAIKDTLDNNKKPENIEEFNEYIQIRWSLYHIWDHLLFDYDYAGKNYFFSKYIVEEKN